MMRCSDVQIEPLPGTAKSITVCAALEYPQPWSHDILDGDTFGPALTAELKRHTKSAGAALQLIRRVGRAGHGGDSSDGTGTFHLYLSFAEEGVLEVLKVAGPEALLEVDLTSGPGHNGAVTVEHPILLVCTHSKRDVCCAIKGRPMAKELDAQFPAEWVWEASHTKGHRFAPSMILLPWAYSYGRVAPQAAAEALAAASAGQLLLPGNRGRGSLGAADQVAELAVVELLAAQGEYVAPGALAVGDGEVTHPDGRRWRVSLERVTYEGVVSSCGDAPKTGKGFRAVGRPELLAG